MAMNAFKVFTCTPPFATILYIFLISITGCSRSSVDPALLDTLPEVVDYNFHVKPILSDRCYACHGPDENSREADLRFDTRDGPYMTLAETGNKAVVPGKPNRSALISRIFSEDPEEMMPSPEFNLSLTEYEKAILERWIEQGAEWKPHWSFIAPAKPLPPASQQSSWGINEIDRFVLSTLEREGLQPSPPASKEQLIRRLSFDLTGLPPSMQEIDDFLADKSDKAYESLVDRLLAKKAYGEHMTSEWLDISRYADTGGYQSDRLRRMWPWRDWVIEAFNTNLPYDQFITWQLAGDLLPDATQDQVLATAFNRNHRQTEEGGSIEEEFRMEYVADRTNTMGTAFMGLTLECARCHDHKYDPITQKDYYRLTAFFNNINESGQTSFFTDAVPVPAMLLSDTETLGELDEARLRIAEKEKEIENHIASSDPLFESWLNGLQKPLFDGSSLPSLTAHFPLDNIENERTSNAVNPAQYGHTVFSPVVVEGKIGKAVQFDGEDGFEFKGAGVFERTDAFSLSFWIKASHWNEANVLVHRTKATFDAGSRGYEVSLKGDKLVAGLTHMWPENAIRIITKKGLPLNQWVHVTMTYDGSSKAKGLKLYANGIEAESNTVRDNLFRNITYERVDVNLTAGYRFRDAGFKDGLIDDLQVYNRTLSPPEISHLSGQQIFANIAQIKSATLTDQLRSDLRSHYLQLHDPAFAAFQKSLNDLRQKENELITPIQEIMVMREMPERRPTHVLVRGVYDNKGEEVGPGTPAGLLAFSDELPNNRLGLAKWLTDPKHPLTSRVAANRYWQQLFGQGLVATPEDFGSQGALPSHPDLLDWLSASFMESGWDTKSILKSIVMSATYRQASDAAQALLNSDPNNVLLARGPKRRLSAEMVRDNALWASGLLVDKTGGPAVKPYQPAGLWKEKSGKEYVRDTGEGLYRRSLYTFWKRTSPPPAMITFDATRRNQCTVRRQQTSTPMQSLVLLNDPQFVEASRVLAERTIKEGGDSLEDRIDFAFRRLTSRHPSDAEIIVLKKTYNDQFVEFAEHPNDAIRLLDVGDAPWDQSLKPQELAASTMLINTIMNFEPTIINR